MDGSVHSAGSVRKGSIMAHGEREEMVAAEGGAIDAACEPKPKMPLLLKVFGVLCIVGGAVSIPSGVLAVVVIVQFLQSGGLAEEALTPLAVTVVLVLAQAAMLVLFILLGVRLLRNKRRYAALTAEVLMALAAVVTVWFGLRKLTPAASCLTVPMSISCRHWSSSCSCSSCRATSIRRFPRSASCSASSATWRRATRRRRERSAWTRQGAAISRSTSSTCSGFSWSVACWA